MERERGKRAGEKTSKRERKTERRKESSPVFLLKSQNTWQQAYADVGTVNVREMEKEKKG